MQKKVFFFIFSIFLTALNSGCGQFDAFVDSRREAGTVLSVGRSTSDKVSICYNSQSTTPAEIYQMAKEECSKTKRVPKFATQNNWDCSFFVPTRIEFDCITPPS